MLRKLFGLAFLSIGLACVSGCGPSMAEVTGTVTVGRTQLDKGVITFIPGPGSSAPPVTANIVNGTFTVPEILYGTYQVTVTPAFAEGAIGGPPEKPLKPGEVDPKRPNAPAKNAGTAEKTNVAIPEKFKSAETSGLSLKVDKSKIDFPVKLD